ncbi:hypothetical protein ESY86_08955 [Subsaximicrobium wynnwilliamsii]|uniref:DUF3299 domain-containing protein n=1 Tax=Subsaximicrobium wynnwilliamsii TaxID=291179 RepID=A0A5C6ZK31_9FLAO|nr:hypothetical protein [Subsaximicrobium wynnwilliamsii]TXD83617.1 hypothetical protein ESY87_08250 [Subsaximicrobium wynnwilliamsii]TXD89498.1 hypothetical protein ESY86_08955 [Subsaximicrobium wynnwilliamsii]TXE03454.1 hypothetical protein ESY88_07275 [Subsaximicrobium wynnwilliamsii]
MKNKILIIISLLICCTCFSQKKITWHDLAQVEFSEKFFPAFGEYFLYPKFLPSVKDLEGKQVVITGYFLNIDPQGKLFILSKGPMSSCFFCGVGGPETAIELQFISKQHFKTDDIVTITGTLKLNADDVEHFNYILTDCKGQIIN